MVTLLDAVTKRNDIDGNVVLFEFLGESDHGGFVSSLALEGRSDEDHDALV